MKFSIDIDGTLLAHPKFFEVFIRAMRNMGHQVGVLSGRPDSMMSSVTEWFNEHNVGEPDFCFMRSQEVEKATPNGAHFKSMIIQQESIDFHFDDYDYDNPETERLFKELGQESRIIRLRCMR